ncbi:hypothetical protein V8C86DRAFT_247978 [Haematococcus lacustris]
MRRGAAAGCVLVAVLLIAILLGASARASGLRGLAHPNAPPPHRRALQQLKITVTSGLQTRTSNQDFACLWFQFSYCNYSVRAVPKAGTAPAPGGVGGGA